MYSMELCMNEKVLQENRERFAGTEKLKKEATTNISKYFCSLESDNISIWRNEESIKKDRELYKNHGKQVHENTLFIIGIS